MAHQGYLTVEGTKQGKFKTQGTRAAHKDKVEITDFRYEVISPRDNATGLQSGKRQHQPLTVIAEIGAASPQFFQSCTTNEVLKTVLLELVHTTPEGAEEVYFTFKLTNATVSRVRKFMAAGAREAGTAHSHEQMEIDFTFEKIELEHKPGQTSAVDDWKQ
jgi:type VI secretion system secreted protein Hcp